jgi:2,5-dioxopentanoate dehydrogenase
VWLLHGKFCHSAAKFPGPRFKYTYQLFAGEKMELHGGNILGAEVAKAGPTTFRAVNPATAEELPTTFHEATEAEAGRALQLAEKAFPEYRHKSADAVAKFLEAIATGLEALGHELIARAHAETALPEPRLLSERGRTISQLKMFATLIREGSWVDARIDRADSGRTPPKPDLRRMLVPMGPVVVFGASNFPLAFSICGGDTASALAAGNPVVAKAHPAHPGTSEMAARVIQKAASDCAMPAGVFSMVHGAKPDVSVALVRHPSTCAVGFTGSLQAGRALFNAAAGRPSPIPLFAEMGSINPVFVLPNALKQRGAQLAQSLAKSVTVGVGQFCTKPGLVVGLEGATLDEFRQSLGAGISSTPSGTMLHAGIAARYGAECEKRLRIADLQLVAAAPGASQAKSKTQAQAAVFTTRAQSFLKNSELREELFGPSTLIVSCESDGQLEEIARSLEGQLTVSVHATEQDLKEHAGLIDILREKAGRLVFGGVPTGVEVGPAMHHGGPYPATTDSRFTSVGTAAILRFVRPVCYQDSPSECLPPELQDENPRGIWRLVDGEWTQAAIAIVSSTKA